MCFITIDLQKYTQAHDLKIFFAELGLKLFKVEG